MRTKHFEERFQQEELSLIDIPLPYFSFLRIGDRRRNCLCPFMRKSKLLNDLLNLPHPNPFFHRDSDNGMSPRIDSAGTVDAFWYVASNYIYNRSRLETTLALLNLRGNALDFLNQTKWLCQVSNLVFLMFDLRSLKRKEYMRICELGRTRNSKFVICLFADSFHEMDTYLKDLAELETYIMYAKDHILHKFETGTKEDDFSIMMN